jgi:integrase
MLFNPAARLKKIGEEQRRERVLTDDELARVWAELDNPIEVDAKAGGLNAADLAAAEATRRALKLLIVLGQRRGETIGMRKDELDLTEGDAWWMLPGKRTKNGLPHRVPITNMAVQIVREAIEASGSSEFVFPSHRTEGAIIPDAVAKALQRMCRRMKPKIEGLGPHDIRRTVGTTMRKLGIC